MCGVRYLGSDGMHEVRAPLVVGADGRFSRVRHLVGFEPIKTSAPMDILWFRLPHIPGDLPEGEGRVSEGSAGGGCWLSSIASTTGRSGCLSQGTLSGSPHCWARMIADD